ncbi:MAG: ATP-binding protein [Candidatus Aenigmatarchaeota archaeon]
MNEIIFDYFLLKEILKPVFRGGSRIVFIDGESGTGKTSVSVILALRLLYLAKKVLKKEVSFDLEKNIVFSPLEYKEKLNYYLNTNSLCLIVDEMRFLIPARLWQKITSQIFSDINATLRSVKMQKSGFGTILIYNSQKFSDVLKETRRTVNLRINMKIFEYCFKGIVLKTTERKFGERYETIDYRPRLDFNDKTIVIQTVYFYHLPKHIFDYINELSTKSKSILQQKKAEQLEKSIKKEFNIKEEGD